jgi:hypothetical protein
VGKNQPSGKTPTDPLDVNDSIDLIGNDIDPDTAGKNQPSSINHGDPSDVNDSIDLPGNDIDPDHAIKNQPSGKNDLIDLFGNDVEPDTAEKKQSSETIPSDTSDVNGSIALSGNDVDPDHNLKNSSRNATDYVDKPGKKQSKGKNPKTTSKVTSNDDISYNRLPEINHSDNLSVTRVIQKKKLEGATRNDNNAPTNVSNEDDNIENANPLFAKPEVFVTKVVDVVVQIHMVEIALFLYGNNTTVVGQPLVNHRPLFISNMKSRDFLDKMQLKSHDFGEEMHVTVYEVRKKSNNKDDPEAVPVYSTYVTSDNDLTGHELTDIVAVYPSVEGLQKLVSTVGLQMQVKDNKPMTIIDIFKQITTTCHHAKDIFTGKEKFGIDPVHLKPNNATQMQTRYRAIRSKLQSQPIRLALLGGLQRCGLTAHLLGNKTIHNKPPHEPKKTPYRVQPRAV